MIEKIILVIIGLTTLIYLKRNMVKSFKTGKCSSCSESCESKGCKDFN